MKVYTRLARRWNTHSDVAKLAYLYRLVVGMTMIVVGAAFATNTPTTGAPRLLHEKIGVFFEVYTASFIVSGVIVAVYWRLKYWYFIGFTLPMFAYFSYSVYAVILGRVSLQGISLFVSLVSLSIIILWAVRDEFV